MTIGSDIAASGPFFPNGVTTAFPFEVEVASATDISVLWISADGSETVISPGAYGVTISESDPGGTVTFAVAPTIPQAGDELWIVLDPEFEQQDRYSDEGPFNQSLLEGSLDALARLSIWLKARVDRALRVPFGDTIGALPLTDARANKFLAFDAVGNPIVSNGTGADAGLRGDLGAVTGPSLVGFSYSAAAPAGSLAALLARGRYIDPRMPPFNAACDRVTDDTAALQAYANYLATLADSVVTNGLNTWRMPTFWIPPGNGAKITAPITIGKNISVVMDAPIWIDAAADAVPAGGVWIDIGREASVFNRQGRNGNFEIDVRRITLSDWESEDDLGVRIDTAASRLWIKRIDRFAIGCHITAPYGVVTLGDFRDNQIGLDVSGVPHSFANQCLFLGGEFANINGNNNGKARYGMRLTNGDFFSNQNSFVFINPSFELGKSVAGSAECISVLAHNTLGAQFRDVRMETSGTVFAKLTGDTRWFQARLLYDNELINAQQQLLDDQSTYKIGNRAVADGNDFDAYASNCIFDSGNLADIATFFGFGGWHFIDMEFINNTDPGTFDLWGGITGVDFKARQVTLGSKPLGVRVDAREAKQFCIVADGPDNKDISAFVIAFDANGNQLTASTDVLQNLNGTPTVPANTGVYGGLYGLSTSLDGLRRQLVLTFSPNVATAFIGLGSGVVRSMKIYAINGPSSFSSKSATIGRGRRLARGAPTAGFLIRGTQIQNTEPTAGGTRDWIVTTQGEFGTLTGITADTTNASRIVTLSSAADLWIGAAITIAGVTGTKIIEGLEGNVAFVDSNCDATVAAGAVAYVAPVLTASAV